MASVASGGTADRIAARILFKVLRAGSGTPARYSSTLFGAPLPFAAELRLPDFTFFMRAMLQEAPIQVYASARRAAVRHEKCHSVFRHTCTCPYSPLTGHLPSVMADSDKGALRPVSDAHLKAQDLCAAIQRDVLLRPRCRSAMFGIDTIRTGMLSGKRLTGALPSYLASFRVSPGRFGSLIVGPLRECKGRPTAGLKVEETKRSTTS